MYILLYTYQIIHLHPQGMAYKLIMATYPNVDDYNINNTVVVCFCLEQKKEEVEIR